VNDGQATIAVKRVNVEETVAWKNGWFVFHHESIQNIMKLATRWYDAEVEYQGVPIDNITLGGNISRYKDISELLQNLKITSGINYKIEGRKVILSN
jgi:ferric-dicitrate binding protein FerR (iron transport regulator)